MKSVRDQAGPAAPGSAGASAGAAGGGATDYRDKRSDERFELNHAPGTLLHKGAKIPCEMLDVSLGGCCMRTRTPFTAGALEWVTVVFSIHGMILSMDGVTQWTRWQRVMGIRFIHPSVRTRNQLAGLLTCLMDVTACEVVKKEIAAASGKAGKAIIALAEPPPAEQPAVGQAGAPATQHPPAPRPNLESEHKVLSLEGGESKAQIYQVGRDEPLAGDMLDVSQDGCLVRLERAVDMAAEARMEVEFSLRGLHFRLPGTTREMRDARVVEIKFAAMSQRKRESLAEAITEMIEAAGAKRAS